MGEWVLSSEVAFVLQTLQVWVGILTLLKFFNGIFGSSILREKEVLQRNNIKYLIK